MRVNLTFALRAHIQHQSLTHAAYSSDLIIFLWITLTLTLNKSLYLFKISPNLSYGRHLSASIVSLHFTNQKSKSAFQISFSYSSWKRAHPSLFLLLGQPHLLAKCSKCCPNLMQYSHRSSKNFELFNFRAGSHARWPWFLEGWARLLLHPCHYVCPHRDCRLLCENPLE